MLFGFGCCEHDMIRLSIFNIETVELFCRIFVGKDIIEKPTASWKVEGLRHCQQD